MNDDVEFFSISYSVKIRILVRVTGTDGYYEARSKAESKLVICGSSVDECVTGWSNYVEKHLEATLGPYIAFWRTMGQKSVVVCPEGRIRVPLDIWECKLNSEICPIQADIDTCNPGKFYEYCLAKEEKKESILKTVQSGKYSGFHHIAGRELCVVCDKALSKNSPFKYHYPIEVHLLDDIFCLTDTENFNVENFLTSVEKAGYDQNVAMCGICTRCLLPVIDKLFPQSLWQFHMLEIDYFGR